MDSAREAIDIFSDTLKGTYMDSRIEDMSETQLGSPVKTIRLALNLTQEEMAAKMGCSITSARRFEYDGTMPKVKAVLGNLRKLAKQAGIDIESEATA